MRSLSKYFGLAGLLAVTGVVFAWYQAVPTFPDPDSYYHARFVQLMVEQGFIQSFPWLPFTTLGESFADHHLFYHILLLPAVAGLGPIVGVKVTQALLCVGLVALAYAILRVWRLPYPALATVLLLTSSPFLVRINLVKASTVAVILFLTIFILLLQRRYLWAAVATVVYSLTHGGFLLAGVLAIVIWGAQLLAQAQRSGQTKPLLPTGVVLVGLAMVIGTIVNPYFPNNVSFLWTQFFQIGVVNYREVIEVGAEWYPYPFYDLVGAISVISIGLVVAVAVMIVQRKQVFKDERVLALLLLVPLFLGLTLRSRRFAEYFVPLLWLLVCVLVLPAIQDGLLRQWWAKLIQSMGKRLMYGIAGYVVVAGLFGVVMVWWTVPMSFSKRTALTRYQAAGTFLQVHLEPGAVVFHGQWDEFPELFYANPNAAYIVGLDATFLYLANQEHYATWREVADGKAKQNTVQKIHETFQADYVIVNTTDDRTKLMLAYLLRDPKARTVFYQDRIRIFHLVP